MPARGMAGQYLETWSDDTFKLWARHVQIWELKEREKP